MLSVKDQMVTKTAKDIDLPEELVDLVVMWGYKDVKEYALRSFKSVELSGFGTMKVSPHRTKKRIQLMDNTINALRESSGTRTPNPKKLESALNTKAYYETKL